MKKNQKENGFLVVYRFFLEAPRDYTIVVFCSFVIGVMEFLGVSSILPAVAHFLGESTQSMPKILSYFFDSVSRTSLVVLFFAMVFGQMLIAIFSERRFIRAMGARNISLGKSYLRGILNARFDELLKIQPGQIEAMMVANLNSSRLIRRHGANFMTNLVQAFCFVVIAITISPQTSILFFIVGGVFVFYNKLTVWRRKNYALSFRGRTHSLTKNISEYFTDLRSLFVADRNYFYNKLSQDIVVMSEAQEKSDGVAMMSNHFYQPIMLVNIAIAIFFAKFVFNVPNSELLTVLFVFYRSAPKLVSAIRIYSDVLGNMPHDISRDINAWHDKVRLMEENIVPQNYNIRLENVYAQYHKQPVLNDVSLFIPYGDLVAIIGKSGSGKSTLIDVICGFKKPEKGCITIGDLTMGDVYYEKLMLEDIALMRPENILISGSLAENIAYLVPPELWNKERIAELINFVGLDEFIGNEGYETQINPRGNNFSTGQRQRILFARALYKNPKILILDEPTSNLDRNTETKINNLIKSLKGKMTVIVISHRGDIMQNADCVYEIQDGVLSPMSLAG